MVSKLEIVFVCCIIIVVTFIRHVIRRRKHPPGPLGLPIFGMLPIRLFQMFFPFLANVSSDAETYKINKKKYGPMWSAELGKQRIVTLSSWDLVNEAFVDNAELFSGRPTNEAYKLVSHGKGIILTDGEVWRGNRQLAIKSLRDLGMGRESLENRISNEACDMLLYLEKTCPGTINVMNALTKGVTNVIMNLVFDEADNYDSSELELYVDNLRILAHNDLAGRKASLLPKLFQTRIMKWFFPDAVQFLNASRYCNQFIREKCILKKSTFDPDRKPECVFDYFLKYRFSGDTSLSCEDQIEEIIYAVFDLFNAGVDTTSNLLSFCCLHLGLYEDLQRELREEINDAIGDRSDINLDSRKHCPKILSFIDEVHRFCCIVPKVHHRVMQTCIFHGYKLFPDDIVFGDFSSLYSDPDLFDNPNEFDPYRFLDESKTKYCPSKYLIAFGIGKRSCLGESIAVMESFIFLVRIIRRFHISLPLETLKNYKNILRGHSGIVHAPSLHFINIDNV